MTTPTEAAAAADLGSPSARKSGRNPRWPFVAVIDYGSQATGVHTTRTHTLTHKAYATRDEAVAAAARSIEAQRRRLAEDLAKPNYRALRAQYGVE